MTALAERARRRSSRNACRCRRCSRSRAPGRASSTTSTRRCRPRASPRSRTPRRDGATPSTSCNQLTLRVALETGDAFVCASERQRDLWLGALAALGRVEPERLPARPVVPRRSSASSRSGSTRGRPTAGAPTCSRASCRGSRPTDRVALWGGGIWNWLDPLTVIRAVAPARAPGPEARLPRDAPTRTRPCRRWTMQARAIALARELDLLGPLGVLQRGLGAVRRARRVPARGRRRRLGTRRRPRDALRVPHAPARLHLGRAADRDDERRLARRARASARARPRRRSPRTWTATPRRSTAVLDGGPRRVRRGRRTRRARELEWPRVVEPLSELLEGAGPSVSVDPARPEVPLRRPTGPLRTPAARSTRACRSRRERRPHARRARPGGKSPLKRRACRSTARSASPSGRSRRGAGSRSEDRSVRGCSRRRRG